MTHFIFGNRQNEKKMVEEDNIVEGNAVEGNAVEGDAVGALVPVDQRRRGYGCKEFREEWEIFFAAVLGLLNMLIMLCLAAVIVIGLSLIAFYGIVWVEFKYCTPNTVAEMVEYKLFSRPSKICEAITQVTRIAPYAIGVLIVKRFDLRFYGRQ